jgi:hypothetical protein
LNTLFDVVNAIIGIDGLREEIFPGVYQVLVGVIINLTHSLYAIFFALYNI